MATGTNISRPPSTLSSTPLPCQTCATRRCPLSLFPTASPCQSRCLPQGVPGSTSKREGGCGQWAPLLCCLPPRPLPQQPVAAWLSCSPQAPDNVSLSIIADLTIFIRFSQSMFVLIGKPLLSLDTSVVTVEGQRSSSPSSLVSLFFRFSNSRHILSNQTTNLNPISVTV